MNAKCKCGHLQERHVFTQGFCTFSAKNEGGGISYCHCNQYEPQARDDDDQRQVVDLLREELMG